MDGDGGNVVLLAMATLGLSSLSTLSVLVALSPPRNLILLFLKKSWKVGGSQKKLETVMIYSLS